jgi:hypothetical protein
VPVEDQRRWGKRGGTMVQAKIKWKIHTRLNTLLLLLPPQESAQTKHRQHCLRPLDEVFALGLGGAVAMVPVGASGRQYHGGAKIDSVIITSWQDGNEQ